MGEIFTGTVSNGLKETLEKIITDGQGPSTSKAIYKKWVTERNMKDYYEDDLEVAGPGLASQVAEGSELATGTITEGVLTRYISEKFGLKMIVTEEAEEDYKYDKIVDAGFRLERAMTKSVDINATLLLTRMFDTNYPIGDGQPIASASHLLPHGGTESNLMATPMSPSVEAMRIAVSQISKMKGHDGLIEGYQPKKIVAPSEQWAVWEEILRSRFEPTDGNFARINVVNSVLNLDVVINPYWSNTSTQWCLLTDADNGFNIRWRRKPRSRSWIDEDNEVMKFGISARWATGISDWRAVYCVQA